MLAICLSSSIQRKKEITLTSLLLFIQKKLPFIVGFFLFQHSFSDILKLAAFKEQAQYSMLFRPLSLL